MLMFSQVATFICCPCGTPLVQVVWKSTTQLGCGYATCSDGPYYVCHVSCLQEASNAVLHNMHAAASQRAMCSATTSACHAQ
jgi:hypothetical protein